MCGEYATVQVIEMPEHHPGQLGGTMRLGKRRTDFKTDQSILSQLCNQFSALFLGGFLFGIRSMKLAFD